MPPKINDGIFFSLVIKRTEQDVSYQLFAYDYPVNI